MVASCRYWNTAAYAAWVAGGSYSWNNSKLQQNMMEQTWAAGGNMGRPHQQEHAINAGDRATLTAGLAAGGQHPAKSQFDTAETYTMVLSWSARWCFKYRHVNGLD